MLWFLISEFVLRNWKLQRQSQIYIKLRLCTLWSFLDLWVWTSSASKTRAKYSELPLQSLPKTARSAEILLGFNCLKLSLSHLHLSVKLDSLDDVLPLELLGFALFLPEPGEMSSLWSWHLWQSHVKVFSIKSYKIPWTVSPTVSPLRCHRYGVTCRVFPSQLGAAGAPPPWGSRLRLLLRTRRTPALRAIEALIQKELKKDEKQKENNKIQKEIWKNHRITSKRHFKRNSKKNFKFPFFGNCFETLRQTSNNLKLSNNALRLWIWKKWQKWGVRRYKERNTCHIMPHEKMIEKWSLDQFT